MFKRVYLQDRVSTRAILHRLNAFKVKCALRREDLQNDASSCVQSSHKLCLDAVEIQSHSDAFGFDLSMGWDACWMKIEFECDEVAFLVYMGSQHLSW